MASTATARVLVLGLVVAGLALSVHGCAVIINNRCPYTVTACARSGSGPTSRYQVGSGGSQYLDFGSACRWPSALVFASVGGQCTDANEANLAEFNIGGGTDYYDLSNVDAYTIGMQIIPSNGGCKSPICNIPDIRSFCQPNNVLKGFPTGALSCHNSDGQVGHPTANNQRFKNACPTAYSYNFDDATSTFTCGTGTNYQVVFCPSGSLTWEEAILATEDIAQLL